jgi:hypothetical protein
MCTANKAISAALMQHAAISLCGKLFIILHDIISTSNYIADVLIIFITTFIYREDPSREAQNEGCQEAQACICFQGSR